MTDTKQHDSSVESESPIPLDPGLAEGRSRLGLFVGMGVLAVGTMVEMSAVVFGGATLIGVAFALNTVGKLAHYWGLPIEVRDRVLLSISWLTLASTVVGLLATFVYARYGPGGGSFFWPLAVAGVGFGLLHMAAQGTYLPETPDSSNE